MALKLSLSEARALLSGSKPKKSKYGNKPATIGAEKYRSEREARRHQELLQLARAGQVAGLSREVPFVLAPAAVIDGRRKPALRYYADFVYTDTATGAEVVEDVKGMKTQVYIIKRHLMMTVHGIAVREV